MPLVDAYVMVMVRTLIIYSNIISISGISEQELRGYTAPQLEQLLVDHQAMGGAVYRTPIMAEHAAAGERD